ncbi:MAG: phospholipase D family protein [Myxococcota bacterium]|nr:phospholipase D family protein [Myxococcota bacterium]
MPDDQDNQTVSLSRANAVAVPVDPAGVSAARWAKLIDRKDNSKVTPFIDGGEAFVEMGKVLLLPNGPKDFIYLAGWDFAPSTLMGQATMGDLLKIADQRGVMIRALFWMNSKPGQRPNGFASGPPPNNAPMVQFIENLKNGAAIHDNRHLNFGSHHQKILAVKHGDRVTAFCGGLDIHPLRSTAGWHDVHCMVEGPGAEALAAVFLERWSDHPWKQFANAATFIVPPKQRSVGEHYTKVLRTYGEGSFLGGLRVPAGTARIGGTLELGTIRAPERYAFAPNGATKILDFLVKAIENTERFIYIEDQYLVQSTKMRALKGVSIAHHLANKVAESGFKKLVILLARTDHIQGEMHQAWRRRRAFINPIKKAAPDKVIVCHYAARAGSRFIHSKTWIFDDEVALIGSANCNRRGYSHDSEVAIAVSDENPPLSTAGEGAATPGDAPGKRLFLAHSLRISLWQKHLKPVVGQPPTVRDLLDPVASATRFWAKPAADAPIEPYDVDGDKTAGPTMQDRRITEPLFGRTLAGDFDSDWDILLDPDGP